MRSSQNNPQAAQVASQRQRDLYDLTLATRERAVELGLPDVETARLEAVAALDSIRDGGELLVWRLLGALTEGNPYAVLRAHAAVTAGHGQAAPEAGQPHEAAPEVDRAAPEVVDVAGYPPLSREVGE